MKIPGWLSLSYKILLFILSTIVASAAASPEYFGGTVVAHKLIFWLSLASVIISGIGTIVGTGQEPSQTIIGKVAMWLLAPLVLLSMLLPAPARAEPAARHKAITVHRVGAVKVGDVVLQNPLQVVDKIRTWIANDAAQDLDTAIDLATKQNNTMTLACWKPIKGFVANVQALPTADKMPKIHLVTDIEILTELVQALQPGSDIVTGCAALANYQKVTAVNMVTGIVTGAAGFARFAPVIP